MIAILLMLSGLLSGNLGQAAFTWSQTPGTVHACVGGDATFPWQYDDVIYDVSMIYWRFVKTGNTILGKVIEPAPKLDYYFDQYRDRAIPMDPTKANAGLILKRVTLEDAGDYKVELSGPPGGVGEATLMVHTDAAVQLTVANKQTTFSDNHPVDWSDKNTITLITHDERLADIAIQIEDQSPVSCDVTTVCSAAVTPSDYSKRNLTVKMKVAYQACTPREYVIFLTPAGKIWLQLSDKLSVVCGTAAVGGLSTGIIIGIVVGSILVVILVLLIVGLVCKRRRERRNRGQYTLEVKESTEEDAINHVELDDLKKEVPPDQPLLTEVDETKPEQDADKTKTDLVEPENITPDAAQETEAIKEDITEVPDPSPDDKDDTDLPSLEELYKVPVYVPELTGHGFTFNDKGELRTIDDDQPFEFNYHVNHAANQKRYEDLGEAITKYIYSFMEKKLGLEKVDISVNADPASTNSFFYASKDAWSREKLLVLIHGSGVVRAGQWARRLIINDDLDKGTQFPYIHWALQHGYGVVSLNTNHNTDVTGNRFEFSGSPEEHASYVWDNYVVKSNAKNVAIVAHSYGGCVVTDLASSKDPDFFERVFAVAMTDSVHSASKNSETGKFLAEHGRNWVTSDKGLDTVLQSYGVGLDAQRVSAGHMKHEWTSYSAMKSVFQFIEDRYRQRVQERSLVGCD